MENINRNIRNEKIFMRYSYLKISFVFFILILSLYFIIHSSIIIHSIVDKKELYEITNNFIFIIIASSILFIYLFIKLAYIPKNWIEPFNYKDSIILLILFFIVLIFSITLVNFNNIITSLINQKLFNTPIVRTPISPISPISPINPTIKE